MVNSDGQLYTIEGFAAALIMLITAYLVLNATSVYTAGDTHITDMQLEALGTDALMMMGTNESLLTMSPLESIIENPVSVPNTTFRNLFLNYTTASGAGPKHDIQFVANYTCRIDPGTEIRSYPLSYSRNLTGGEHTVRATRWVMVNNQPCNSGSSNPRAVLVEVLLWRD
jgi:hypothetical protein